MAPRAPVSERDGIPLTRKSRSRPRDYSRVAEINPVRSRVSVELNPSAVDNINALRQMHGEVTTTQVIRMALESHRKSLEEDEGSRRPK